MLFIIRTPVTARLGPVSRHVPFEPEPGPTELELNDIGEIRLRTSKPLIYDGYRANRLTGSFILVEQGTNTTVAAGMLTAPEKAFTPDFVEFAI